MPRSQMGRTVAEVGSHATAHDGGKLASDQLALLGSVVAEVMNAVEQRNLPLGRARVLIGFVATEFWGVADAPENTARRICRQLEDAGVSASVVNSIRAGIAPRMKAARLQRMRDAASRDDHANPSGR